MIPFSKDEVDGSIPERFTKVVAAVADHVAIKSAEAQLTYQALDRISDQMGRTLLAKLGSQEGRIAFLLPSSSSALITMLGILKAGKCYVALDVIHPVAQLKRIVSSAKPEAIITTHVHWDLAIKLSRENQCRLINFDTIKSTTQGTNTGWPATADSLGAIFYTSGSTGEPKGVVWNQRNLLHLAWGIQNDYQLASPDNQSLIYSCGFGASTQDIFGALLNGSTLYPYDVHAASTSNVVRWLQREQITVFHLPMPLFRQVLTSLQHQPVDLPFLRALLVGGQALYPTDIETFRQCFNIKTILMHQYALSEVGMVSYFFINSETPITSHKMPIGVPILDRDVLILDEAGQPVDTGEPGEIAIRSDYLASGYWHNSELTEARFLPDFEGSDKRIYLTGDLGRVQPNGCLEHLGRTDFMVKIQGYRVETDAIASNLLESPQVKDAVVTAYENEAGDTRLIAYIVPHQEPPKVSQLHQMLQETFPNYMMPAQFKVLNALPLLANGKVDRKALPKPDKTRPVLETIFVEPGTPIEQGLCAIWCAVLDLEKIGIHDSFVELGGQSLQAMRIAIRIKDKFGVEVPMTEFFNAATIAEMAVVILTHLANNLEADELGALLND